MSHINKSISKIVNNILSSNKPDFQGNSKSNPSKYQMLRKLLEILTDKNINKNIKNNIEEKMESLQKANRKNKAINTLLIQPNNFLPKSNINSLRLTSKSFRNKINNQNNKSYSGKLLNPVYFKKIIERNGQKIKVIRFNSKYLNDVNDEIFLFLENIKLISIHTIDLANCELITDDGLINLAKSCPNLQSINLAHCDLITDDGLINLTQSCPKLQSINLAHCDQITDNGLFNLAKLCPNLQSIDLSRCYKILDNKLTELQKLLPELKIIREMSLHDPIRTLAGYI